MNRDHLVMTKRFRNAVLLAVAMLFVFPAIAAEKHAIKLADLEVTIWIPDAIDGPKPTIIFSHGYLGCNEQSIFLTEGLANAGYVVLSPNHLDTICVRSKPLRKSLDERTRERRAKGQSTNLLEPEHSFLAPQKWNDRTHTDRRDDMLRTLDLALGNPEIAPMINESRIGLMGHSTGGYAALGIAGAWPSWKDRRIKAVLALSPYSLPFHNPGGRLNTMNTPVMFQGGTADFGITPFLLGDKGSYAHSSKPKYLVEFAGLNHFSWTNLNNNPTQKNLILGYARGFFDKYLSGRNVPSLTRKLGGVSKLFFSE